MGIAVGAAIGGAVGVVVNDRRSVRTIAIDQKIRYQANLKIASDAKLNGSRVVLTSFNRAVLIVGQTPTYKQLLEVQECVASVPNVKKIYNELTISAPVSNLTNSSDAWITLKLRSKMLADPYLNSTQIKIVTENGVVYLVGIVTYHNAKRVIHIARTTKGVQRVVTLFEYGSDENED